MTHPAALRCLQEFGADPFAGLQAAETAAGASECVFDMHASPALPTVGISSPQVVVQTVISDQPI